jgi:hypothetical protein
MSRLSLQEHELKSEDNIFIINPNSNHNYENFIVGSGIGSSSVGSFRVSGRIRSGRVSDYLISGYFESRVVSDRIG